MNVCLHACLRHCMFRAEIENINGQCTHLLNERQSWTLTSHSSNSQRPASFNGGESSQLGQKPKFGRGKNWRLPFVSHSLVLGNLYWWNRYFQSISCIFVHLCDVKLRCDMFLCRLLTLVLFFNDGWTGKRYSKQFCSNKCLLFTGWWWWLPSILKA